MTEETDKTEINVRETPEFRGLASEASRWKAQAQELADYKAKKDAEEETRKQNDLVAQKKFEEALKLEQSKYEELTRKFAAVSREKLSVKAENVLRGLGLSDSLKLRGAVSMLPDDVTEETLPQWAEKLRTDLPDAFAASKPTKVNGAASVGTVSDASGEVNWAGIKAAINARGNTSEIEKARKEAGETLSSYIIKNGSKPPNY